MMPHARVCKRMWTQRVVSMGSLEMASPSGMASWPPWETTRSARNETIASATSDGLVLNVAMTVMVVCGVEEEGGVGGSLAMFKDPGWCAGEAAQAQSASALAGCGRSCLRHQLASSEM